MTQMITSSQKERLECFLEDVSTSAIRSAIRSVIHVPFNEDELRFVSGRGDFLRGEIERATANILKKIRSCHPPLEEGRFLRPIATSVVPARRICREYFAQMPRVLVTRAFLENFDIKSSALSTTEPLSTTGKCYVSLLMKQNAYVKDMVNELPKNHLSPLEDIVAFIEDHKYSIWGSIKDNNFMSEFNTFFAKGKNGEIFCQN